MASAAPIPAGTEPVKVPSFNLPSRPAPIAADVRPAPHGRTLPLITSATRLPVLDGLRGTAILLVIVYHLLIQLQSNPGIFKFAVIAGRLAWSGVDLFFVLSGFLIGGILLDARHSPRYYKTFYARRAFRILPIYAVLLAFYTLRTRAFHWIPGYAASAEEIPLIAYLTFTQNFWMAYIGSLGTGSLCPTWSLAIEEQFYVTLPLVVRNVSRRKLLVVLVAIIAAAPVVRLALLSYYPNSAIACYVLMPCRADALSLGVLAAILVRNRRSWDLLQQKGWILGAVAAALFVGVAAFTIDSRQLSGLMISLRYSVLGLFYASCLLLALTRRRGIWQSVLTIPALTGLGAIAYFTYLFHIPVIEVARRMVNHYFATRTSNVSVVLLAYCSGLALTFGLAALSWKYFEKPLVRKGRNFNY